MKTDDALIQVMNEWIIKAWIGLSAGIVRSSL